MPRTADPRAGRNKSKSYFPQIDQMLIDFLFEAERRAQFNHLLIYETLTSTLIVFGESADLFCFCEARSCKVSSSAETGQWSENGMPRRMRSEEQTKGTLFEKLSRRNNSFAICPL